MHNICADLHIHSVLSPCADRTMTPQNIYPQLFEKGINAFAICDHNSTKNVKAFYEFGQKWFPQILFLPGIEITTEEEVHIVGIFESIDNANQVGELIRNSIKEGVKNTSFLEPQLVLDIEGNIFEEEIKPLYFSSGLDLESAVTLLREYNTIVIASHIDRPSFSVTSQLGFIPDKLFDVLEISPISVKRVNESKEFVLRDIIYPLPEDMPVITSSDAHSLDEIGHVRTILSVDNLSFECIREGIKQKTILEVVKFD